MSKSLMYRYGKSVQRISLSEKELEQRFAYRTRKICEMYYRVGDIRRALNYCNCSLGTKIRIISLTYCPKFRRTKIVFSKVREHKHGGFVNVKR